MIKAMSILFVSFILLIFIFAMLISFIPTLMVLNHVINWLAIGLMLIGILLILALIIDRIKDQKKEGDDYKRY